MGSTSKGNLLLGVGGGIAAYKAVELARRAQDAGWTVRVVMTTGAQEFVTALTFQAATGNAVHTDLLDADAEAAMGHIELARWADRVVIAPATANVIARAAAGIADDLLTTVLLATKAPVFVCPAMNQAMWSHPATASNTETLRQRGVAIIGPGSGLQACGDEGPGRMLEPMDIVRAIEPRSRRLAGRKVVMTAGPTLEDLDPVRYLGNRSSGKMGVAVAEAFRAAGADVILVLGPARVAPPPDITVIEVRSALQMHKAVFAHVESADVFVGTAAVADFRPADPSDQKIKKGDDVDLTVRLVRNPDILADVAALEQNRPFTVGFAAETQNVVNNARAKFDRKKLDMIAANQVGAADCGFEANDNELTIITRTEVLELPRAEKTALAKLLVEKIADCLENA